MTTCDHGEIYHSAENDNYYCKQCHAGMGHGVYSYISQLKNKAASEIEALQKKVQDCERYQLSMDAACHSGTATDRQMLAHSMELLRAERDSLRARVAELEKDNAALHDRCTCAFCKQEFSKRDLAAVADHLVNCEQSPLVKRGKELFEMCNILEAKIAELEAEANKEHANAVKLCDKLIEARRRIEELEKYEKRLDWVEANCVRLIYKGFQDDYLDFSTVTVCKAIDNAMQNK